MCTAPKIPTSCTTVTEREIPPPHVSDLLQSYNAEKSKKADDGRKRISGRLRANVTGLQNQYRARYRVG